jgi:hypothetical protein
MNCQPSIDDSSNLGCHLWRNELIGKDLDVQLCSYVQLREQRRVVNEEVRPDLRAGRSTRQTGKRKDAIAGRSPVGRPLRRRREMMPIYGRQRLRGTAAPRRQNSEAQTPNPEPRTSNPPGRHRSSLPRPDDHCWPIPWRAPAPSAP